MYNNSLPGQYFMGNPLLNGGGTLPVLPTYQQQQQPFNGLIWVKSEASAMQISLPPNSTSQPIMNENGREFYVVSTDGAGTKSLEKFDYSLHIDEPEPSVDMNNFVSREEFNAKINQLMEAINGTNGSAQATQTTATPS